MQGSYQKIDRSIEAIEYVNGSLAVLVKEGDRILNDTYYDRAVKTYENRYYNEKTGKVCYGEAYYSKENCIEFRFYDNKGMLNGEMYSIYYDKKNNKFKIDKTQYENNNFKGCKAITTEEDIEVFFQKFGNTDFSMKLDTVLCSKNDKKDLNLFNQGLCLAKHIEKDFNYKKALQDCLVHSDKTETLQVDKGGNRFRINFDDDEDKGEENVLIGKKKYRAKQDREESLKPQCVNDKKDKQKDETENTNLQEEDNINQINTNNNESNNVIKRDIKEELNRTIVLGNLKPRFQLKVLGDGAFMFEIPDGKKEILNNNTTTLGEKNNAFKPIGK